MADNNNSKVGYLPKTPDPSLRKLDRIIGKWQDTGDYQGTDTYEWMEGGFFLIHHFDGIAPGGFHAKGVEYIGFDEDTQTLHSHLMDIAGSNFTYTWNIENDILTIRFGEKDSDNFYQGEFSKDGNTITGGWQWPEEGDKLGGYKTVTTRMD